MMLTWLLGLRIKLRLAAWMRRTAEKWITEVEDVVRRERWHL